MENDRLARLNTLSDMTYTYPDNGIRPHAVTSAGGSTYTYDYNGNMTRGAGRSITYNHENMPLTITANGITTSIDYDGFGERVKKTTGTNATVYINGLYECTNGTCVKYIFANGQRIAAKTASNISYFHPDHLGSSSVITASSGLNVENLAYYPFGQTMIDSGSTNVPYKYTGQELDAETGLYNYNARLYDPVLGKFITADSIVPNPGDPQSFNRYSYVRNNPINLVDPSGHWSIKIGGTKISGDDKVLAGVEMAVGAVLIYAGGGSPVSYVGLAMMSHGADTLGGDVNTGGGASVDSSGNIDPYSYNPNDPGTTFGAGGNSGGSGIGGADGSVGPVYFGHLTIYGYGDPYSSVNITDLFWELGGITGHWKNRHTGGVTLNSRGVPIGEVGLESNFFDEPTLLFMGSLAKVGRAGAGAAEFFQGTRYSTAVLEKMKFGDFHNFPELVTNYASFGTVSEIKGGDGLIRQMLRIPGSYGGKEGAFEFIKDANGEITHRFFRPN